LVVVAPVVAITPVGPAPDLARYGGVVLTSENALSGLPPPPPGLVAWCVGGRTAEAAARAGYDARAARGTADHLVAAISAAAEAGAGRPLLHARGSESRGDVAARLAAHGIPCDEAVVYAQADLPLSDEARRLLERDEPVLVPLFSPNSAARLSAALAGKSLRAGLLVAAMSRAVGAAWSGPAPVRMVVAARPDSEAMLDALGLLADTTVSP
jgi:uroporphyrinogen-III synthase